MAGMEGEAESKHVPESEIIRSPLQMPRVFNRLVELPIIKSTCGRVSGMYDYAKENSKVAMIGLSATEVSLKAVGAVVKVTYTSLPSSGLVGSLKGGFEDRVSRVDTMACNGLQFLENQWPKIKDRTDKIVAAGNAKLEQSDLVEALLTVTEAAVDFFKRPQQKPTDVESNGPPVVQTKVDRIRGIFYSFVSGGEKVLIVTASVPLRVTLAGINGAKTVVLWSLDTTKSVLHRLPVVDRLLAALFARSDNDKVFFSPVVLDDGREVLGRKQKPRRSTRYKPKGDYHRIIEASEPFPVSPERKRKFDKEDGEETLTVALISVPQDYASDEDPDYVPDPDEQEDSESLEDDDDEGNTEYENEGDEQDESRGAKISDATEEKARIISSLNVTPLKDTRVVQGEGNVFNKSPTEGNPQSPGVQNLVEKIEVQMTSASQKTENLPAKEAAKTGVVNGEGKISNKPQTKVGELSQGVKNLVEKIKVKSSPGSAPRKAAENVSTKEDAKTGVVNGEGKVTNKTQSKASESNQGVQNIGEKIDAKRPAPQKTENVPAKEDAKTGVGNGEGKATNKTQSKASESNQGVQNKGEKIDSKRSASQKTENFSLKTALRKQAEQVILMEGK